ncbi:MAG TPA: prolyl oligopeptidase family serine peptidase [Pyrinomonadaceae bacterium]|nr:prolyl oligopeptidase family serine peptidase [Pyrinomonadaceae bacterium]
MRRRHSLRSISVATVLVLASVGTSGVAQQRPLTSDDVFRIEELSDVKISPDGKWLAYVIKRPKSAIKDHMTNFISSDVWLVATEGGEPRNITRGAEDGAGYWNPVWSPDSRRLVMSSTKGGNVRLWVLEISSGAFRQLAERGVENRPPVAWVSDNHLAFPVLPESRKPIGMMVEKQAAEVAMREWPKAWKGDEATLSVIESGVPVLYGERPQGQLLLVDAEKGTAHVVADGTFGDLSLSPNRRYLALLKQVDSVRPDPKRPLQHWLLSSLYARYQLVITSAQGKSLGAGTIKANLIVGSIRWSPDCSELAVIGRGDESSRVYRYRFTDNSFEAMTGDDLQITETTNTPTGLLWSGKGNLLVFGERTGTSTIGAQEKRTDWWVLEAPGHYKNLTAGMKSAPVQLVTETSGESFVGIADGDLWRVTVDGDATHNLTQSFDPKITSLVWPNGPTIEIERYGHLVVASARGTTTDLHVVELSSGHVTSLAKPAPTAQLADFAPASGLAAYVVNSSDGTSLWVSSAGTTKLRLVFETNTFLHEVAEGHAIKVEYRGLDAQDLKAWLILPIDYKEGKRYPLVVRVYPGSIATNTIPREAQLGHAHSLNYQLLAARGYAVLLPSMPLKVEGEASDPYMELTKGVLPAVDKVIELGIADQKRLAVMGQSFGGYGTYGLVTQTNRFRAAVALAGLSDLVSMYGIFDARMRYEDVAHEIDLFRISGLETGWGRMLNPPWKDIGRYLRNSPIFYVDRVETPLMIIQGDMDFVPIQQGEEFFTALYRQGKRAAFVRYWGEGHVLRSPANIRDMWQRVFAWYDEFLDVSRSPDGSLMWDGDKVKSRNGALPLKPQDFARFDQMIVRNSKQ